MNVLSLFDGISVGQLALKNINRHVDNYFASEVSDNAIAVTNKHFPDTIQLGNIQDYYLWSMPQIDLMIGGSPCQGFSFAGKELNFNDSRSKLFFEFVYCLDLFKPKYFLLENVVMRQEYQDIITRFLGVEPVKINSSLVSAQNRNRLYWANFPITQPEDKEIYFSNFFNGYPARMVGRRINEKGKREDYNHNIPLVQYIECREDNKSSCITTASKDCLCSRDFVKRSPAQDAHYRYLTMAELEWLQTLPFGYTDIVKRSHRVDLIGNAWTVKVIEHIFSNMPL